MYNNKFIVAVKHEGKIMREINDIVYLPFGSDYSLLLKNQNITKAVADIKIDGLDVLDGNSIIVEPNSSLELKGFMDNSTVRNKFRFIEKTKKIYDFRGSRIDDGMIRVEYKFEKKPVSTVYPWYPLRPPYPCRPLGDPGSPIKYCSGVFGSPTYVSCCSDDGITVKGKQTDQSFVKGEVDTLEDLPSVITILLKGKDKETNKFVNRPLTVKTKITCPTCGTKSKSFAKFCRECGTFLG